MINESLTFATEKEAIEYQDRFLSEYAGAWNPYDGSALIIPPNHDKNVWTVRTSRRRSAD